MIYGIGTDICDVRRIAQTLKKHPQRLPQRIFGPNETAVYNARSQRLPDRGMRYLASRFSAKEAFSKAIGLGIRTPMRWSDCEILNQRSGQPYIQLHGLLADWCAHKNLSFSVSLSDETDYAVGFVIAHINPSSPPYANQSSHSD